MSKPYRLASIFIGIVLFIALGVYLLPKNEDNTNQATMPSPTSTNVADATSSARVAELKIEDIKIGTGSAVKSGDTVVINYKGTLLDGKEFDSSYKRNQPFETQIGVGAVIKGWDEGVVGMKVGGKRKLTIPADMAYGGRAVGLIPANSPLVFELELLSIQ